MEKECTFRIRFPGGVGTIEVEPDHPLVGPWRVAIREGRPPGKWHWLLAEDEATRVCKILGLFVHSAGDRLLYFPGASIGVHEKGGDLPPGTMDRLTLDPPTPKGRHTSHVALVDGGRGNNRGSRIPGGRLVPWFSFLTPNVSDYFLTMPAELRVSFPLPRPDVHGFANDCLVGPAAGMSLLPLPACGPDTFFQMDVLAGRTSDWQSLPARPLAWAFKRELVSNAPLDSQSIRVVDQKIEFGPSVGVRVMCMRPVGQLAGIRILRPRLNWAEVELGRGRTGRSRSMTVRVNVVADAVACAMHRLRRRVGWYRYGYRADRRQLERLPIRLLSF